MVCFDLALHPPANDARYGRAGPALIGISASLIVSLLLAAAPFAGLRPEWMLFAIGAVAAVAGLAIWRVALVVRTLAARGAELAATAEQLRRDERRFRDWAEISSEWFWEQNADLRYTSFADTVGRPGLTFDLIGQTRWEMVKEGVSEEQWAAHRAQLAARLPFRDFRYIRTGADGKIHHISVSGKPIFDASGRFCGYRGAGREVSVEVQGAEALRRANAEAQAARADAERLRQSAEEANRNLLEAQRIGRLGHWIADERTRTVTCSPQMFEITGLPPQPTMALDLARVPPVHPEDRARFLQVRESAIASGETVRAEVRFVRPDGDIRWVHIEMRPHYDEAGTFARMFGTTQDITERRQAEDDLRAARERLVDAIESISEGFALFDSDDRYVLTNSNYRRFYADRSDLFEPGMCYEEVMRRVAERGHEPVEDPQQWLSRLVRWHRACAEPLERRLPDGRWIRAVERRTSSGGIVAIRTDITERKLTEEALRIARDAAEEKAAALERSEARFRDFALASSHWLWETDPQHRLSYVSEGVSTFGWSAEALVGCSRRDIAADAEDARKWREHHELLERREPLRDFTYRWRNPAGREGVAAVSGDPVFAANGVFLGYRGTGRDITQQVTAETALREAKQAAEAASLAKSQFLANMSHELRTPLNSIIGFSEMIEQAMVGPLSPQYRDYGNLIHHSGDHLLDVINDILDLAKVDAGKFDLRRERNVDPRDIVEDCVALTRGHADAAGVRVATSTVRGLPLLDADPTRLKQILLNLLSNAIKFTGKGGRVVLAARRARDGGGVLFEVRDRGSGMTAAEIEIALEPFGQVDAGFDRRHEGTGLGLPLARGLAELHGGSLSIASIKGSGTTVRVLLPAPPPMRRARPAMRRDIAPAARRQAAG